MEQLGRPCSRALACWSVHFDAEGYFRSVLTAEEFSECFLKAPPSKVLSLIELIEQARKSVRAKNAGDEEAV
jgi:hypothetical protein